MKNLIIVIIFIPMISYSKKYRDVNIFKKADLIMEKISKYTNRLPNKTVKKMFTSKEEIVDYLNKELKSQYPGNQFEAEETVMKLFGIIKKDINYKKAIGDILKEQVAGYYNPFNNTMYITDWIAPNMQEIILSHELFHAVQEKNFGIKKVLKLNNDYPDKKVAFSSLIEGEATAIMIDYSGAIKYNNPNMSFDKIPNIDEFFMSSIKKRYSKTMNKISDRPDILQLMLIFPYVKGIRFVQRIKKSFGWKGLDKVYNRPPISTEQILHIKKYILEEKPIDVQLKNRKNIFKGANYLSSTQFGESGFNSIFSGDKIKKTTTLASDGYNGDRIFVWKKNRRKFAVLISYWDTKKDAKEFFLAISIYFKNILKKRDCLIKDNRIDIIKDKLHYYIKLDKTKIIIMLGVNDNELKQLNRF